MFLWMYPHTHYHSSDPSLSHTHQGVLSPPPPPLIPSLPDLPLTGCAGDATGQVACQFLCCCQMQSNTAQQHCKGGGGAHVVAAAADSEGVTHTELPDPYVR